MRRVPIGVERGDPVTIEFATALCTDPACDWFEDNQTEGNEPTADVHALDHHNATGHRVLMNITAHV